MAAICTVLLAGCGINMPIQQIGGTENEYILNRDDKTPFGNLAGVKKEVLVEANEFCASRGKKFVEKYSIDHGRAVFVWPETTLYFMCLEPNKNAKPEN